ncbi:MAG: C39 family peptidase [Luteolibacter sp.]
MAWIILLGSVAVATAETKLKGELDGLFAFPQTWETTQAQIEKLYGGEKNEKIKWLTQDRTRAKFSRRLYLDAEIDLTLIEGKVPVEEAIVDFADGKINLITLSIFNRGDGGTLPRPEFERRLKLVGAMLSKGLAGKAMEIKADKLQGLLAEGYRWNTPAGMALLECNEGALASGPVEFLRLRVARKGASGSLASSMSAARGGAAVTLSDLPRNVKKDGKGNVIVSGLPMVDQGNKGYCVVASVQRLFEYYGMGADMHQIAEVSKADPEKGTNTLSMAQELDKIDFRFKTRLKILGMMTDSGDLVQVERDFKVGKPVDEKSFLKVIRTHVNDGLPLLWSLEIGRFPEVPDLRPQTEGGHMRLIIGYNDTNQTLIFTDSWGAGHEQKTMKMGDAYQATTGFFVIQPTVR